MRIGYKESKFYEVNFPNIPSLGDFYLTTEEIQQYQQIVRLNPSWIHQIQQSQKFGSFQVQPEYETKVKEIKSFYQEHNIDEAYRLMLQLKEGNLKDIQSNSQNKALFKQIQRQYKDVLQYSSPIGQPGWILKQDNKGVKIFTKNIKDQLCVLIQSGVSVPVEIFLQAMVQLDLFNKIIPMVEYSKQEKIVARNMKIGNFIVNIPVLSSRQAFYQGIGYDRLKTNGTIFLYIRSIHNQPDILKQLKYEPKFHKNTVPLQFKFISLQYTPKTQNTGICRLCLNINLNIKIIPNFILEAVLKTFSIKIFENILKVSTNFKGSEWEKRAIQNPQLFSFFQAKAKQYFRKK